MATRNALIEELEERLWNINGVSPYTYAVADIQRNPRATGSAFPAIYIIEGPDDIFELPQIGAGGMAVLKKRRLKVVLELWNEVTVEGTATQEILNLYDDVRCALFTGLGGGTLDGQCRMEELGMTPIEKPTFGGDKQMVGTGMKLELVYKDTPQETY